MQSDPRIIHIRAIVAKNPSLRGKKISELIGMSPSGMYYMLKSHGMTLTSIKKDACPAFDGEIEHPPRPATNPIVVPEWLTRPLRSYRHTNFQYQNGVPG